MHLVMQIQTKLYNRLHSRPELVRIHRPWAKLATLRKTRVLRIIPDQEPRPVLSPGIRIDTGF